jgi:hypothetical protein
VFIETLLALATLADEPPFSSFSCAAGVGRVSGFAENKFCNFDDDLFIESIASTKGSSSSSLSKFENSS